MPTKVRALPYGEEGEETELEKDVDKQNLLNHIHAIDAKISEIFYSNITLEKQAFAQKIEKNELKAINSELEDLYRERATIIAYVDKHYWLFALEAIPQVSDIIGFSDGDVLAQELKDVRAYMDPCTGQQGKMRVTLSFYFRSKNEVFSNKRLDVLLVVKERGDVVLLFDETFQTADIEWSSGCWAHGGPQLLSDRFFSLWTGQKAIEKDQSEADWKRGIERGVIAILTQVINRSAFFYRVGLDMINRPDNEEDYPTRIGESDKQGEIGKGAKGRSRYHVSGQVEYLILISSFMFIVCTVYFLHLTGVIGKGQRGIVNGQSTKSSNYDSHPHSEWYRTSFL
jgi:hypothetical protein